MRKSLVTLLCLIFVFSLNAQEGYEEKQTQNHPDSPTGVLSVDFGTTKGVTMQKLRERSDVEFALVFQESGSFGYTGFFLGRPTAGIELFFENSIFYRATFGFVYSPGTMIETYNSLKKDLISLYGSPDYEKHFISSTYSSGQEEKAVLDNRAAICAGWVFKNNTIIHISIFPEYINLVYYDKNLYDEYMKK